jgi:hypothetical protein
MGSQLRTDASGTVSPAGGFLRDDPPLLAAIGPI